MAFLCGFFGLAIFPCLFYYDEALRRSTGDEALRKDESSEFRQIPSDLLELRSARTDAKLVRSHDASLVFKGNQPRCKVTVGNTTCEYPGRSLSPDCCKTEQELVCYGFKERNIAFWTQPPCDKLNLERNPSMKACKNLKDGLYLMKNKEGMECMKAKLKGDPGQQPLCKVKVGGTTCEFPNRSLSPACCKETQTMVCHAFKEQKATIFVKTPPCNKLNLSMEPSMEGCMNAADANYVKTNNEGKQCMLDAQESLKDKMRKLKRIKGVFSGLR
eukprot:TRINITY_DN1945_c0_g1_i5.p1 TRINITY_DN1945_c0_g1~~TRINITY_DN1945_c0_g1_i5.p1  ORF type:complete len:290 (-),score=36.76 TRINITY_DN1945_c0_g1_i5:106-924(-)